jgi:hypothetical protein
MNEARRFRATRVGYGGSPTSALNNASAFAASSSATIYVV